MEKTIINKNLVYKVEDDFLTEVCHVPGMKHYGPSVVEIPEGVRVIKSRCFVISEVKKIVFPKSLEIIETDTFNCLLGCIRTLVIPKNVTRIGDRSFQNTKIQKLIIESDVIDIGYAAFYGCGIEKVIFKKNPVSSIRIDARCFYNNNLKKIVIPEGVTILGEEAFSNNIGLSHLDLPNSLMFIYHSAFEFTAIKKVKFHGNMENVWVGRNVFEDSYSNHKLQKYVMTHREEKQPIKAYKAFHIDTEQMLMCRNFCYGMAEPYNGETYKQTDIPIICSSGFHACLNPLDCLSYYNGAMYGEEFAIYEVEILGDIDCRFKSGYSSGDTKLCTDEIKIGKRLTFKEVVEIGCKLID